MSTINGQRQVGHGVGGGNASIDNQPKVVPGGWAGWIDDDNCYVANGADGWIESIFTQSTGQVRRAITDPANPRFGAGINSGFSGGGVWAGWAGYQPPDPRRGLATSTGLHFPDAGLLGVGPDGALGFKPSYQSLGPTMVLELAGQQRVAAAGGSPEALAALEGELRADGLYWQLSGGSAGDLCLLGQQRAIWQEGNRIHVFNLTQPLQLGAAGWPKAYLCAGRWWLSYWSDVAGIILHPFDELNGVTVVPPGVSMWHSARSFDTQIVFALFPFEAEQAGQLLGADGKPYVPGSGVPLTTIDTATAVLKPLQPPSPPLVLQKPTRKMFAGWFEYAASPFGPGNAVMAIRNQMGAIGLPAIVSSETYHLVQPSQTLGMFLSGTTVEAIEAAAAASTLRPVAYWDANTWPRWPSLPKGSWLCVRAYCPAGMSPDVFKTQTASILKSAPAGVPLVLVGQQYSSNNTLAGYVDPSTPAPQDSTALKPIAVALVELANATPSVIMLCLFSGYGRRGGLMDHPDLVQPWTDWAAALQAPAIDVYPPQPKPPDPPDPPKPPSGFIVAKPFTVGGSMLQEKGGILGVGGKFGRMGPVGSGLFKRRGIIWDGDPTKGPVGDYEFTLTETTPGRGQAVDTKNNSMLGADLTQYSGDETHQFYGLLDSETPGDYETPFLYIWTDQGVKQLAFRFPKGDDRPNPYATSLTWVTQ
jgi:hypothetical protein